MKKILTAICLFSFAGTVCPSAEGVSQPAQPHARHERMQQRRGIHRARLAETYAQAGVTAEQQQALKDMRMEQAKKRLEKRAAMNTKDRVKRRTKHAARKNKRTKMTAQERTSIKEKRDERRRAQLASVGLTTEQVDMILTQERQKHAGHTPRRPVYTPRAQ